jgi:proteasome lid subunit RPN8/RPN11
MRQVRCDPAVVESIVAHAKRESPNECCGLLVGSGEHVVEAVPARNLSEDPSRRFLLDPGDHIVARRAARDRGLAVVGFYHSHPKSKAWPSVRDIEEASYPDHLCAIVSLDGEVELRVFELTPGRVEEVKLY